MEIAKYQNLSWIEDEKIGRFNQGSENKSLEWLGGLAAEYLYSFLGVVFERKIFSYWWVMCINNLMVNRRKGQNKQEVGVGKGTGCDNRVETELVKNKWAEMKKER